MLLNMFKLVLWAPVYIFSGFRVNLFSKKPKKGGAGLPTNISRVEITPKIFTKEKSFIKEWSSIMDDYKDLIVYEICPGVSWNETILGSSFNSVKVVDKYISGKQAVEYLKKGQNGENTHSFLLLVDSFMVKVIDNRCKTMTIEHCYECTDHVYRILNRIKDKQRHKELIDKARSKGTLPDECTQCGFEDPSIDMEGCCTNCGYTLIDLDEVA